MNKNVFLIISLTSANFYYISGSRMNWSGGIGIQSGKAKYSNIGICSKNWAQNNGFLDDNEFNYTDANCCQLCDCLHGGVQKAGAYTSGCNCDYSGTSQMTQCYFPGGENRLKK